MALWCRDLPVVTVPRRDTPKPVTLIYPYYENPTFLTRQMGHWFSMPLDLRRFASLIIVDDGSPAVPAERVMRGWGIGWASVRLFRIGPDVRWNWLAARNIGFHHAPEGWCLVTDMDHVVNEPTLRSALYGERDPDVIYAFSRVEHTGAAAAPHSASFLMTREMFWNVGGYDEALSGHYGTDGDWRRRCARVAPMQVLTDPLVRYEYVGDSSTTRYLRKQPEDAAVKRIVAARKHGWTPKTLSFPYHEVTLQQEAACR